MRKMITLVVYLMAMATLATPVRSLVAARNTINGSPAEEGLSARDYIQDGLIAMWDCKENIGYGKHDDNAQVWVDLTGNGHNVTNLTYNGNGWVNGNARLVDRPAFDIASPIPDSDIKTVSVCCKSINIIRDQVGIIDFGNGNYSTRIITIYGKKNCFICQRSTSYSPKISDVHNLNSFTIVFNGDKMNGYNRNLGWYGDEPAAEYVAEWAGGNSRCLIGTYKSYCSGYFHNIRVYNRMLSQEEITYNWNVDRVRFNLP